MQFLPYLSPDMAGFREMPATGKLLYLMAQVRPTGSLSDLARQAGLGERSAFKLASLLKKHHWLRTERRGHKCIPIPIIPKAEDERRARLLRECYAVSQYKGEFLLTAIQEATTFMEGAVHNARPKFLEHPVTGERLELDVFTPETRDAWELHGFQHFGPSEIQPSKEKARLQQANDLVKLGASVMNNVNVAVMTYRDLSLDGVLKKMPEYLPRKPVDRASRFIQTLERLALGYRRWAARTEARLRAQRAAEEAAQMEQAAQDELGEQDEQAAWEQLSKPPALAEP